jgi:hypothetical protein
MVEMIEMLPIGNDQYRYRLVGTRLTFGRIVAGIGFPGKLPGYCCVMAETYAKDPGLGAHIVHLLAERESDDPLELLTMAGDLKEICQAEYLLGKPDEADTNAQIIWNQERESRSDYRRVWVTNVPLVTNDRIEAMIHQLRRRMQPTTKTLILGDAPILQQRLSELPLADRIPELRGKDHPAVAGAGYALMWFALARPSREPLPTNYLEKGYVPFSGV